MKPNIVRTKTVTCVLMLALFTVGLAGCNTVSGLGQDLQSASESTSRAIDKAFDGEKDE